MTPKTAEEKAKAAEELKAKQLAEIEEKKKKREQVLDNIVYSAPRKYCINYQHISGLYIVRARLHPIWLIRDNVNLRDSLS